jgi:ribonuclease HI
MKIYIDGACKGNGKPNNIGGWGFVVVKESECFYSEAGISHNTTNNREELKSLKEAILWVLNNEIDEEILIVTDSQYVKNGLTQWINSWLKTNWKNGTVKNQDLWKDLLYYRKGINLKFEWVKGHSGDKFNELVDELINLKIKTHLKQ